MKLLKLLHNLYCVKVVMKILPKNTLQQNQLHFHLFCFMKDYEREIENRTQWISEFRKK